MSYPSRRLARVEKPVGVQQNLDAEIDGDLYAGENLLYVVYWWARVENASVCRPYFVTVGLA